MAAKAIKAEFYDVKSRAKVELTVACKAKTEAGRSMLYGKTEDGRLLPKFIKGEDFDGVYKALPLKGEEPQPAEEPKAKKTCAKRACGCKAKKD